MCDLCNSGRWVGTWATAPQLCEDHNMPPDSKLAHTTLRQIVRVSIGGSKLRLKLSNEYGRQALNIQTVTIAESTIGSKINPTCAKAVTFDGSEVVIIPPGKIITSDPIAYNLPKLSELAITIYFGDVPSGLTGHPGSRTTSYIEEGNVAWAVEMANAVRVEHWYFITGIDIFTTDVEYKALVALGDSITDGRGSTTNKNDRWPDILANRLQMKSEVAKTAVLNLGIGGNAVLSGGLGPTVSARFCRDVLNQRGVSYLIVFAGINDIGNANVGNNTVPALIAAYQSLINVAHAQNIFIYGATLLPFFGSFYYSSNKEQFRQAVNEWIKTSSQFDQVIDFDAALQDPVDPLRLYSIYDSGDHLHPNAQGHRKLGETVDMDLFLPQNLIK